ncbi:MAG: hypothetical protein ACLP1D_22445 [Xanthobacteraceae bacterium]
MDQAAALLAALEAAAGFGNGKLDAARVEAIARPLGLEPETLPALISRLEKAGRVAISWGGLVEVLPEQGAGSGVTFNMQGATFGPGATFAGRDAHGAMIHITPETALAALVAVIENLRRARPGLHGEAAEAMDSTIEVLQARPPAESPPETRRKWVHEVATWLPRLLAAAPQLKDAVDLGEEVVKGLGWS